MFSQRPYFAVSGVHESGVRKAAKIEGASYLLTELQSGYWWITAEGAATKIERIGVFLQPGESVRRDILLQEVSLTPLFLNYEGESVSVDHVAGSVEVRCEGDILGRVEYSLSDCLSFYAGASEQEPGSRIDPRASICKLIPSFFLSGLDSVQELGGLAGVLRGVAEQDVMVYSVIGDCVVGFGVIEKGVCRISLESAEIAKCLSSISFTLDDGCDGPANISWEVGSVEIAVGGCRNLVVTGLVPGAKRLYIESPAIEARAKNCILVAGQQLDLGTIACGQVSTVRGVVYGPDGPVAGAVVACWRKDNDGQWIQIGPHGWEANGDGEYEIPVEAGDVLLSLAIGIAANGGRLRSRTTKVFVSTGLGDVRKDIIGVRTVPVTVYFSFEAQDARLVVEDENGGKLEDRAWVGPEMQVHLPPGQYNISLSVPPGVMASRFVDVRGGMLVVL